jgi:hypothetical protein
VSPPRRRSGNRYFCRQCGRTERAELPPAGWLRVQVADPELSARRAAGWGSTAAGGLFCGLPCLIAWASSPQAQGQIHTATTGAAS